MDYAITLFLGLTALGTGFAGYAVLSTTKLTYATGSVAALSLFSSVLGWTLFFISYVTL